MKRRIDKYISFHDAGLSPTGKTRRWNVHCLGEKFGDIRWYGGWRKYVFQHDAEGFMDSDCLQVIAEFCIARTKEHYATTGGSTT
jgi:hypothetical protein